jgi:hypothetical protein
MKVVFLVVSLVLLTNGQVLKKARVSTATFPLLSENISQLSIRTWIYIGRLLRVHCCCVTFSFMKTNPWGGGWEGGWFHVLLCTQIHTENNNKDTIGNSVSSLRIGLYLRLLYVYSGS